MSCFEATNWAVCAPYCSAGRLDQESPLHVMSNNPVEDTVLQSDTVPMFLPEPTHQGGGVSNYDHVISYVLSVPSPHHTTIAQPLIILPVQSEGVPSSGGLPIGRGNLTSPAPPPQGEELKQVLLQQLEYYFSKDNLSSDKYLCEFTDTPSGLCLLRVGLAVSQMDGDNYVPVSVISNFNQVRYLIFPSATHSRWNVTSHYPYRNLQSLKVFPIIGCT